MNPYYKHTSPPDPTHIMFIEMLLEIDAAELLGFDDCGCCFCYGGLCIGKEDRTMFFNSVTDGVSERLDHVTSFRDVFDMIRYENEYIDPELENNQLTC